MTIWRMRNVYCIPKVTNFDVFTDRASQYNLSD